MNALSKAGFPVAQTLADQNIQRKEVVVEKIMHIFAETIKKTPLNKTYEFIFNLKLRNDICDLIKKQFADQTDYVIEFEELNKQYIIGTAVRIRNTLIEVTNVFTLPVDHEQICHNMCRVHADCPSMERKYNSKYYD